MSIFQNYENSYLKENQFLDLNRIRTEVAELSKYEEVGLLLKCLIKIKIILFFSVWTWDISINSSNELMNIY